ncbi:lysophospholipid acyltransferase family protein [Chondrinema litorale]|uniref:lysophospholipid acyltransferase family protein n=1 Tax=Chondrinema litorale TaxID=2994555 RepID=UPI0025433D12|nr:lysophospholipid acyltransferase family protein [Chondrinema litorale]UZR92879.1 lysophospholipid acyltransferase family protein [Chondrinema litorale]
MIYSFLKIIVKIATRIFFKKISVNNKKLIPEEVPLIVVANHPNTFMDPVLIAALMQQQVYFLAKSTVFGSPIKDWFLGNILNMIPVYRKQDLPPGKLANNQAVFEKCFDFLKNKGTLLIFPEGTSVMEKKLREIKTGTARIALGAEAENNFNLGVKILTVGINYSEGEKFRSDVTLNIDEPINVSEWKEVYNNSSSDAAHKLTDHIREKLEKQLVVTIDKDHERLLEQTELIFKNELAESIDLPKKEKDFLISKGISEALKYFEENDSQMLASLKTRINTYFRKLDLLGLHDGLLKKKNLESNIFWKSIRILTFLIVGSPIWLIGLLTNYIPYILPSKIAPLISKHIEFRAPVMMAIGVLTFSIYYFLTNLLVYQLTHNWVLIPVFTFLSAISGFFVLLYWNVVVETRKNLKLLGIFRKEKDILRELIKERKAICKMLEKAKDQYLNTL